MTKKENKKNKEGNVLPFSIRNPNYRNQHFVGVYKEIQKIEEVRLKEEKESADRLKEGKIVERECRFFSKRVDAIKFSEKLKKAHGINYIGLNSRNDRIEAYYDNLVTLLYFIMYENTLELEHRYMALEALWITEEPIMKKIENHFDRDGCYIQETVSYAVMQIEEALKSLQNTTGVYCFDDL